MNFERFFLYLLPPGFLFSAIMDFNAYFDNRCVSNSRGYGKWCGDQLLVIACLTLAFSLISGFIIIKYRKHKPKLDDNKQTKD